MNMDCKCNENKNENRNNSGRKLGTHNESKPENNHLLVTEFDLRTTRGATQMIKALIPMLSPREQRIISILVRIWELIQTIQFFQQEFFILSSGNSQDYKNSPLGINGIDLNTLNRIKKYCSPDNQQMIDTLLNFMNISEIMKMSGVGNPFENASPDNANLQKQFTDMMKIFQDMGNMGNMGNMENIENVGNVGNMGNIKNMGNTVHADNMSDIGNINNAGNADNMNDIRDQSNTQNTDSISPFNFNTTNESYSETAQEKILQSMMNENQRNLYDEFMRNLENEEW